MVMGMWSLDVIKAGDIGQQTLFELSDSLEIAAVQFLLFQILEEALHNRVVIRMALGGEGLDHSQLVDNPAEIRGGELRATIRMEHDALGDAAQPDRVPQGVQGQEAVDSAPDPAGDHLSGIEVQNGADVMELSTDSYIGKIADPDEIGRFLVKVLGEKILADVIIFLVGRRLWRLHGAHLGQFHLFHQPVHPTFADVYAMLPCKTEPHLPDAQPLVGSGIGLQDPSANLQVLLLPAGGLPPQVLVVGAAVDPEHAAEDRDAMLAGQGVDGAYSLSECGVKIAIAFFKMRFSSSSSALRF